MKVALPEPLRPLTRPSPAWLVGIAAFGSSSRLLSAPWMTGALALLTIVWLLIRREFRFTLRRWVIWMMFAVTILTSAIAWQVFGGPIQSSYFLLTTSWAIMAVAVLSTSAPVRQLNALTVGFSAGLLLAYAVGLFEIITGFKVSLLLHPTSSTASRVAESRFIAQSVFVNTNDFAVALVVLVAMLSARLVFDAGRLLPQILRLGIILSAAVMSLVSGSRGATLSLGLIVVMLGILYIRQSATIRIGRRWVIASVVLVAAATVVLWVSPWVQDSSTASRERIASNMFQLLAENPGQTAIGFGTSTNFTSAATQRFGKILMDPHNIGLELIVSFGIVGLLAVLGCFCYLLWRSIVSGLMARYSLAYATVTLLAMAPLIGIVPSAFLPYPYLWVGLIATSGWLAVSESRPELQLRQPR